MNTIRDAILAAAPAEEFASIAALSLIALTLVARGCRQIQQLAREEPDQLALAGLSVLLLERSDRIGGSTAVSGGAVWAPLYSQMLVGMVAQTGQWWLDVRKPKKEEVVAHLVNLAWNGLEHLEAKPRVVSTKR